MEFCYSFTGYECEFQQVKELFVFMLV